MYPILSIEVQIPAVFVPNIEDIPLQREWLFGEVLSTFISPGFWLLGSWIFRRAPFDFNRLSCFFDGSCFRGMSCHMNDECHDFEIMRLAID